MFLWWHFESAIELVRIEGDCSSCSLFMLGFAMQRTRAAESSGLSGARLAIEQRVSNWMKRSWLAWTEGCDGVSGCQARWEGAIGTKSEGESGHRDIDSVQAEVGLECIGRQ